MPTETEAKFRVKPENVAVLKARIRALGASSHGLRNELNEFFDTKKLRLDSRDEIIRLRTINNKISEVTFKGRKIPNSKFKCREEIEFQVNSKSDVKAFLKAIGYKFIFGFEKRRQTYSYRGCVIEIDEIPTIGWFCEIEGRRVKVIKEVVKELGYDKEPMIKKGYGQLLIKGGFKSLKAPKTIKF